MTTDHQRTITISQRPIDWPDWRIRSLSRPDLLASVRPDTVLAVDQLPRGRLEANTADAAWLTWPAALGWAPTCFADPVEYCPSAVWCRRPLGDEWCFRRDPRMRWPGTEIQEWRIIGMSAKSRQLSTYDSTAMLIPNFITLKCTKIIPTIKKVFLLLESLNKILDRCL